MSLPIRVTLPAVAARRGHFGGLAMLRFGCKTWCFLSAAAACCLLASGCAAFPDRLIQPLYHNPFPQLHKVAVLPFYNQSKEPTVDGEEVANAYYNELQAIPGFEVMPVGVAKQLLAASGIEPRTSSDFQRLAKQMGVDAVLIGSITEFTPYYPPRMGLAVDWYAANPGFHPIPAGYGLPWGTASEEYIPSSLVQQAEFELAREQLKTQTPELVVEAEIEKTSLASAAASAKTESAAKTPAEMAPLALGGPGLESAQKEGTNLPEGWPDPRGFVPAQPAHKRPDLRPQYEPVITHTRLYHGQDAEFTQRLATYFYFRDDARFGGWQGYLQRPEDFARFCCHLHLTETLAARGGAGESRVVWRWPLSRYER